MSDEAGMTIARAFVEARQQRRALLEYPGEQPASLDQAYRIQDHALAVWNRPVGGWKVGRINSPLDDSLGANRLSGPIFADTIIDAADLDPQTDAPEMPVFAAGFAAAEAEFMLRLDPPADDALPRDDEETLAWIDQVRIGLEIASSPYPRINADGPCVTVSDHGNNAGLVLGPLVDPARWSELGEVEVVTRINERIAGQAKASAMLDGPLGAVRFLLANLRSRGVAVQSGWWVSTGAVTGVHGVRPGDRATGSFAGLGDVASLIVAAE